MKTYHILLLFFVSTVFGQTTVNLSHTNVQNENQLRNTQLMLFNHYGYSSNTNFTSIEYFKKYLAYDELDASTQNFDTEYALMDSFLFSDRFYLKQDNTWAWDGIYKDYDLDYYLNNIFFRTKTPIVKSIYEDINGETTTSNNVGLIENKKYPVLSYRLDQLASGSIYTLKFDVKKNNVSSIYPQVESSQIFQYGIQYYDDQDNIIPTDNNLCLLSTSSTYNFCIHQSQEDDPLPTDWTVKEVQFEIPSTFQFSYAKLRFLNFQGFEKEILIDNVSLVDNNTQIEHIPLNEGSFDLNIQDTNWDYDRTMKGNSGGQTFLFKDRTPLIKAIYEAKKQLIVSGIDTPKTKLIFLLPKVDFRWSSDIHGFASYYCVNENYVDGIDIDKVEDLKLTISRYIKNVYNFFGSLSEDYKNQFEIAGFYFMDEDLRQGDNQKFAFLTPIFDHVKNTIGGIDPDAKLFGSPFLLKQQEDQVCTVESAYRDEAISNYFDLCWQQPGVFFNSFIDREYLRLVALDLAKAKTMGVNIESRVLVNDEPYGRIQDYFDYGKRLGYVNYSKLYFDNAGAHYLNSISSNPAEKIDYHNLYDFIRESKKGVVVNNGFEIKNDDTESFFNWSGSNYQIYERDFSATRGRNIEFLIDKDNFKSDFFPIVNLENYLFTFQAKSANIPSSINFQLELYNNSNSSIPSEVINNIVDITSISYENFTVDFLNNTQYVKAKLNIIQSAGASSGVEMKNLKLHKGTVQNVPDIFYTVYNNLEELKKEEIIDKGNYSLVLSKNDFIESEEKISINPKAKYKLSIDVKEVLPIYNLNNNKAYLGLKAYDKNGNIITNSSDVFGFNSSLANGGTTFWRYIEDIKQDWTKFTINSIGFSENVASIKLVVKNFYYNNDLIFDNINLEYDYQNTYLPEVFPQGNKLKKLHWNERFPTSATKNTPVFYKELIDVSSFNDLSFSASFRDKEEASQSDNATRLLAIEFLDENFNLINTSVNGLSYSDFFKYHFKSLGEMVYKDCDLSIGFLDQWINATFDFSVPVNAKWMRIAARSFNTENEMLMLNPVLSVLPSRNSSSENYLSKNKIQNIKLLNEEVDTFLIEVYPNPTKNIININLPSELNLESTYSEMYDVTGKRIATFQLESHREEIPLHDYKPGVYFLLIKLKNQTVVKKVIKM